MIVPSISSLIQMLPQIFIGITGVGFVIAFHEFGHFLFCKLFHVYVESFSIGFGPRIFQRKIGETTFAISLIPLGGYVEADADHQSERSVTRIPYWQKMCIVFGGIFFNLILSYCILLTLSISGIPSNPFFAQSTHYSISQISPNSAAEQAGIIVSDKIKSINNHDVSQSIHSLLEELETLPEAQTTIVIERDGKEKTLPITLGSKEVSGKQVGILGVGFAFEPIPSVSFKEAIFQAASFLWNSLKTVSSGLFKSISRRSADGMAGPLMLVSLTVQSAGNNFSFFFLLLAFISIGLAVLNLLPIPVLDGGQALIYSIEALIGRPIADHIKQKIWTVCWALAIVFFCYLTFKDAQLLGLDLKHLWSLVHTKITGIFTK